MCILSSSANTVASNLYSKSMDNLDAQVKILLTDAAPFEYVISHLMSAHNESRVQAERFFNACKQKDPQTLLLKLVHILQHGSDDGLRSMAAVLLRKNIALWTSLHDASQATIKAQLLSCLVSEVVRSVWKVLCDTIAELASCIFYEDAWPELLPLLFRCSESADYALKEKSLLVLGQLKPHVFAHLRAQLGLIHSVFHRGLSITMPHQVQLAALRTFASFVQSLDASEMYMFQDLLRLMMQTLISSFEARNERIAQEILEALIEVAGSAPGFLKEQFHEILNLMIGIVEAQGLEDGTRHLGLEFVLTLSEARGYASRMMRTLTQVISRLFAFLLNLLEDVGDNASWFAADAMDMNAGLSNNFVLGKEGLDRLSIALGGKIVFPIMYEKLVSYMNDSDWKKRHAALVALSQTTEGCRKLKGGIVEAHVMQALCVLLELRVMIKELESVLHMVLVSFGDPHTRVRWAAINAMGQLYMDFGPEVSQHFHQKIAPVLIDAVGDFQNTRIQAQAAAAIVSFCKVCSADDLKPWLCGLTEKLLLLLKNGKCMQREIALTALAAVAESAQSAFQVYYDIAMPYLKHIYHAMDDLDLMLYAKTMDCISVIGLAVGMDKFSLDATEVMNVLLYLIRNISDFDDPTANCLLQTSSRMCKCLGKDFLRYMDVVMPPLLEVLQLNHGVSVTDANDMVEQVMDGHYDREAVTLGNKRISFNISLLESKAIACDVLFCYLDELKEEFYPWMEKVLPIVASLVTFPFHAMVRMAAVSAMPQLLFVAKSAVSKGLAGGHDASYLKELSDYIISSLVRVLSKEQVTDVLIKILGSLEESLQISRTMPDGQVQEIVDGLKDVLTTSMIRTKDRQELKASNDFDDEELELLQEEDVEEEAIFLQVSNCIGTLAKLQKSAFASYFNELVPFITPVLDEALTSDEKCVAICTFNDVAEHCGTSAARYYGIFLPFLIEASVDDDADVRQVKVPNCIQPHSHVSYTGLIEASGQVHIPRLCTSPNYFWSSFVQAAVYGLGICAKNGDARLEFFIKEALRALNHIISHQSAFQFENRMATDNAISALGKICEYRRDCIDATQVIPIWLCHLPIRNDLREAKVLHQLFFSMVARLDPLLLGQSNENLPKILSVFAEILIDGGDLASEEMLAAIPGLLQKVKRAMEPAAFAHLWKSLSPDSQNILHPILEHS